MISRDREPGNDTRLTTHNSGFMQVSSLEGALQCAELIAKSSFCPKGMSGRPGDIVIALQMGQELGLKPMQALQNIAVINGRPSLWGDAVLAVCRQSPEFEYIKEEYLPDTKTYVCRVKRRNEPEFTQTFSEADTKLARLWGKEGPWTMYPRRMLQMRARGFALRDAFPDLLRGILIREEAEDLPRERVDYSNVGETIEGYVVSESIDESQLSIINELLVESGTNEENFCNYLNVGALNEMTQDKYQEAVRLLQKKVAKNKKGADLEINQMLNKNKTEASDEIIGG